VAEVEIGAEIGLAVEQRIVTVEGIAIEFVCDKVGQTFASIVGAAGVEGRRDDGGVECKPGQEFGGVEVNAIRDGEVEHGILKFFGLRGTRNLSSCRWMRGRSVPAEKFSLSEAASTGTMRLVVYFVEGTVDGVGDGAAPLTLEPQVSFIDDDGDGSAGKLDGVVGGVAF
jgi:hypothetical protein